MHRHPIRLGQAFLHGLGVAEAGALLAHDPGAAEALADALAVKYEQYRERPFERVIVLRIAGVTGWAANDF